MFYFTTEALVRTVVTIAILDLAMLGPALWFLWKVLWKAGDVLTHMDIDYHVEHSMREWRVKQYAQEQQEKEASHAN